MAEQQACLGGGGARGTQKTEHTVETDSNGNQVPKTSTFWSPCGRCGGSGVVIVG
jgi:hypothetical protein